MMKLTAADGHEFGVFEAGNVNAPRGLVVLQEIFGVNRHMRSVSEHLAQFGYRVLCPALYDRAERDVELGYTAEDVRRGLEIRSKIPIEGTIADLAAAAAAFGDKPVGVIGYCWGGSLAWLSAGSIPRFKAAISWYGGEIFKTRDMKLGCPAQLHFGEADAGIPMENVQAIKAAQPQVDVFTYPGAEHGFGCEERPSFSPKDNELAELRSMAFFAEHLR